MTRFDIINKLIQKHSYKTYLEIGTQFGQCFKHINIENKICVDPVKCFDELTHEMTSDEFFEQNTKTFDIIFVDGLHLEHQSTKDIHNSIKVLNENGTIIAHDCLPQTEEFTQLCHSGTVYRSIIDLRYNNPELTVLTIDTDCGCTMITKSSKPTKPYSCVPIELAKTFYYYKKNQKELMNVVSIEEFQSSLNS